jgi:tetrapyrrole methylase family protein/MazG family protein
MEEFDRLVSLFERLRGPGGCPWDAEQDHKSISRSVIEEAYELFDAIHIDDLAQKLISRHPHVFADARIDSSKEVIRNWEKIKESERDKSRRDSILDGIPGSLPSLLAARKIQSVASRVGFDWQNASGVIEKLREEIGELDEALEKGNKDEVKDEIGDLFFSIVNLARLLEVDPESALRGTNRKFRKRFSSIEKEAKIRGIDLNEMTLQEMDEIWDRAKGE